MIKIQLSPTPSGLWQVDGLSQIARRTKELESSNWPEAAEMRFDAVQALLDKIGDEELSLDWNHAPTRSAMELLYSAAADQLAIGEVEMAVALWESLAALDEEDHMSVSVPLAFLAGFIGTITSKESVDPELSAEMEVRSMTGAGVAKALSH